MTFFLLSLALCSLAFATSGCSSTPTGIPDHRPGDFRLGVVVMGENQTKSKDHAVNLAGGDGRYIIDSSSVLRASFGAGSTLDTFPGFTRRLSHDQMDAVWLMSKDLLDHNKHLSRLHSGQPQSMLAEQSGTIIEIHMNAQYDIFVFDQGDQQAAAIVDALAALAWVDTTTNKRP